MKHTYVEYAPVKTALESKGFILTPGKSSPVPDTRIELWSRPGSDGVEFAAVMLIVRTDESCALFSHGQFDGLASVRGPADNKRSVAAASELAAAFIRTM